MHLIEDVENLIHHPKGAPAMTADTEATAAPAETEPERIVDEFKSHLEQIGAWARRAAEEGLPPVADFVGRAKAVAASATVQTIAKAVLTPAEDAALNGVVTSVLAAMGKAVDFAEEHLDVQAPAEPEAPAEPVVAGGQPQ
jgi:hypothetical protein